MECKVLIIESRSHDDIFNDIHEGKTLKESLRLQGVHAELYEVATEDHLKSIVEVAAQESVRYVHISAHGSKDGFELTDGSDISWEKFDKICWPHFKDCCLVFSSCDVAKGVDKLFDMHKTFCNAIVAPTRKIYWSEGLVAYSAFYHRASKNNSSTENDVKIMNKITEPKTFKFFSSPSRQTTYVI